LFASHASLLFIGVSFPQELILLVPGDDHSVGQILVSHGSLLFFYHSNLRLRLLLKGLSAFDHAYLLSNACAAIGLDFRLSPPYIDSTT
jgi:hypothetical protein